MERAPEEKALVILSGGQDSATCLYWALEEFPHVEAITFDYGQRHRVELECAAKIALDAQIPHVVIPINSLSALSANALTSAAVEVKADGGFQNLPSTFVPGRNILFLTLAASHAAPRGIANLVIGACETDFSGYPDCRDRFLSAMEVALSEGLAFPMAIQRPLMRLTKANTFRLAAALECLDVVLEDTHTCYEGVRGERHAWGYGCGRCPACELRRKGYEEFRQTRSA